ncbi:MAG: cell division protein FtsA [Pelosinus sp.]|jgi:cell division protein FtsA|nr:cell division protein FtsA [Pelosinus sp.]
MEGKYILGIDVGTSNIKVLLGKIGIDESIEIAGSGSMPTEGFTKGVISNSQILAQSIAQAVDCTSLATNLSVKEAYIGIGGMELSAVNSIGSITPAVPNNITLDDMRRVYHAATLVAAIPDEHEILHVLPQKFFVDKQRRNGLPLQEKGSHLEVEAHIVSIPKLVLNNLVKDIEDLGIHVNGVIANAIAVTETITPVSAGNFLVMDIGAGTTELVLYKDGHIYLSTALTLGGNYITNDIMQGLDISWEHAEEIKRYYAKLDKQLRGQEIILDCNAYNTTDKHVSYDFLYDIVESRICELVYLIHDHIKVFLEENKLEKIFLTGGCGAMPSFVQNVEATFSMPVEIAIPQELLLEYSSPRNTACYGILKYAVKNLPKPQATLASSSWRLLMSKCRKFLKN